MALPVKPAESLKVKLRWCSRLRPRFSLRSLLVSFIILGVALSYVGSYVSRSLRGRYEPMLIGLGGVKGYAWAPQGFVTDFEWDFDLLRWYYPLYRLDNSFWHTWRDEHSGKYPINEVSPDEIWKVYKAWDAQAARARK